MDVNKITNDTVIQIALVCYLVFPLLSLNANITLFHVLRRTWKRFEKTEVVKQKKTTRDILKAIFFSIMFLIQSRSVILALSRLGSGRLHVPLSPSDFHFIQAALSFVPPFYVYELIHGHHFQFDPFIWLHHGLVIIGAPFLVSGTVLSTDEDTSYTLYVVIFVSEVVFANFVFYLGAGVARLMVNGKKRYYAYLFLFLHHAVASVLVQIIVWTFLGFRVSKLSWPFIVGTIAAGLGFLTENAHATWITYCIVRKMKQAQVTEEELDLEK